MSRRKSTKASWEATQMVKSVEKALAGVAEAKTRLGLWAWKPTDPDAPAIERGLDRVAKALNKAELVLKTAKDVAARIPKSPR